MIDNQLENLRKSIAWAEQDQDLNIFRMAGEQLQRLESYVLNLSEHEQHRAFREIDNLLPVEWPLWMEACRYSDGVVMSASQTLH